MRWTVALLFVGFWTGTAYAQANPDPAVSHPVVCKKGGNGPAGNCVPFDPNNPEHRKLLEKTGQTPPDIRSAPPVQPPPPPDPITSLRPTDSPPLVTAPNPALVPKQPASTAPEPYCDLACSQAKLHQFDTPPSQPGQAPPGAGALWGSSQAMRQRQESRRAAAIQQQKRELQAAQGRLTAAEQELRERMAALPPERRQKVWDQECQSGLYEEGDYVTLAGEKRRCYQGTDGLLHATAKPE